MPKHFIKPITINLKKKSIDRLDSVRWSRPTWRDKPNHIVRVMCLLLRSNLDNCASCELAQKAEVTKPSLEGGDLRVCSWVPWEIDTFVFCKIPVITSCWWCKERLDLRSSLDLHTLCNKRGIRSSARRRESKREGRPTGGRSKAAPHDEIVFRNSLVSPPTWVGEAGDETPHAHAHATCRRLLPGCI